jgi:hypothetical protein
MLGVSPLCFSAFWHDEVFGDMLELSHALPGTASRRHLCGGASVRSRWLLAGSVGLMSGGGVAQGPAIRQSQPGRHQKLSMC